MKGIKSCYFFGRLQLDEDYLGKEDRREHEENIRVNLLLIRFNDADGSSSVISLADGDSHVIPYFSTSLMDYRPLHFRFYTKLGAQLRNPLFLDLQGEGIYLFTKAKVIDGRTV